MLLINVLGNVKLSAVKFHGVNRFQCLIDYLYGTGEYDHQMILHVLLD